MEVTLLVRSQDNWQLRAKPHSEPFAGAHRNERLCDGIAGGHVSAASSASRRCGRQRWEREDEEVH
jgi:hypothetical protein